MPFYFNLNILKLQNLNKIEVTDFCKIPFLACSQNISLELYKSLAS